MAKLTLEEYNKLLLDGRIKIFNRTNPGQDTNWDAVIIYALVEKGVDEDTKQAFDILKKKNLILMPNIYNEGTDLTLEQVRDGLAQLRELFIEPPEVTRTEAPVPPTIEVPIPPTTEAGPVESPTTPTEEPPAIEEPTLSVERPEGPTTSPDRPNGEQRNLSVDRTTVVVDGGPSDGGRVTVTVNPASTPAEPTEPPTLTQSEIDMKILMDAYREAILKKIEEVNQSGIDSAVKEQYLKNLSEIIANDENLMTYVKNAINTGQISQKKLEETINRGRNIIDNNAKQADLTQKIETNNEVLGNKGHPFLKMRLRRENKKYASTITKLAKSNVKLEGKQREFFLNAVEKDKKRMMRISELQLEYAEAEADEAKFAAVRDNSRFITKAIAARKANKANKRKLNLQEKILELNGKVKVTGARELAVDPRDYEAELEAENALVRS